MKFLLFPDYAFGRIYNIPVEFFFERGINTLLVDADNTLAADQKHHIHPKTLRWIYTQKQLGMRIIILSNNSAERLYHLAKKLDVGFVQNSKKPFPAKLIGKINKDRTALIGDQIFTDILAAKVLGCMSVKLSPISTEKGASFRIRRRIEKPIMDIYFKMKGVV